MDVEVQIYIKADIEERQQIISDMRQELQCVGISRSMLAAVKIF